VICPVPNRVITKSLRVSTSPPSFPLGLASLRIKCPPDYLLVTMAGSPSTSKRIHSGVRRRRAILSCHACRTRRLKCDRVRPICGRCARNEDECVWAVDGLSRFPSDVQQHPPSQSDIEADPIHPPDDTTMDTESEVSVPEDFSASAVGQGNHPKNPWTGYLTSQHGGRSRYIPSSFWANIDHDVRQSLNYHWVCSK